MADDTVYDITEYWDFCKPGEAYEVRWYDPNRNLGSIGKQKWVDDFGGCTRADDYYGKSSAGTPPAYEGLGWQDSWYYVNDPCRGVLEIADNGPKTTIFDKALLFWSPYKHMVYTKGMEIPWGGKQKIGDWFSAKVQIDPTKSAFLPPFIGYWSYAQQNVAFTEHYDEFTDGLGRVHKDVIKLVTSQPWGQSDPNKHSCLGCNYYLAKGIGRVAVEWTTFDDNLKLLTTSEMDSAVYTGSINLPM